MPPTRKTAERLALGVKTLLNRPDEDDLFEWPDEYLDAVNRAHRRIYNKIAQHAPGLIRTSSTITSSDGGASYDLGDFHLGQLEVYIPPGPPQGARILPADPDSSYFGFWVDGTKLRLTYSKYYDYLSVLWSPETVAEMAPDDEHVLPAFCESMLQYEAAFLLGNKPGFAGNPGNYAALSAREWRGDPTDPSDMGILGTIKRLAVSQGFETAIGLEGQPWWRNIS